MGLKAHGTGKSLNKMPHYQLNDRFSDTRAVATLNGTQAVPGPGTRTVVDTNSKISNTGGVLNFATGATANDGVWYASVARAAGVVLVAQITPADTNGIAVFGFDSNQVGAINDAIQLGAIANVRIVPNGGSALNVGTYSASVTYTVWAVMRATGFFWLIRGGTYTYPTLVYITALGNAAGFPALHAGSTTSIFTAALIRMPLDSPFGAALWLPAPLASDGFGSSFGTLDNLGVAETTDIGSSQSALTWTHNTYSVSSSKAINTPGLGSELLTNGSFTSNTTGWTAAGGNSSIASVAGGQSGNALQVTTGNQAGYAHQSVATTAGDWLLFTVYWKQGNQTVGAISIATTSSGTDLFTIGVTGTASWQQKTMSCRATTATTFLRLRNGSSTNNDTFLFDEASVKKLTLADLFASVRLSTVDVISEVAVTISDSAVAGLMLSLDSTSSPANFVIIYLSRQTTGSVFVDKYVAGAVTAVNNTAITYSAGAVLRVAKLGSAYRVYYNNAFVVAVTISDSGVINNTLHGLFDADSGANSLDNFACYASGSGGEYGSLNNYLS